MRRNSGQGMAGSKAFACGSNDSDQVSEFLNAGHL
jgi:hypothetical protein